MPIRTQALLLFNLIVMLLTVMFAWRAATVASQAVRQRIVQQTASNTATFLASQRFPISDHLLSQLNRMFDVQFVAIEKLSEKPSRKASRGKMLGTSLQGMARQAAARTFENLPDRGRVEIDGTQFFYHADKTLHAKSGHDKKNTILYVLIPESQLSRAATTAFWGVVRFGLLMLVVGSVLTWFFAERFTRPIRRLACAMDDPAQLPVQPSGTSDEIRQLYRSFAQLLERQERSRQVLVDSERLVAIGRMAAAVAHELRNPLSGIKMNLQVLRDELNESTGKENQDDPSLELALQEVDRMELYLKEIMHLVVPVSGGNSHHASAETARRATSDNSNAPQAAASDRVTCRPAEAIRSALMLFAGRLRHANLDVEVELPDDLPNVCLGDSEYRQVLANLLINAIEATPERGTIHISVAVEKNGPDNGQSMIKTSVSDSGSGVLFAEKKDPFRIFTSTKVDGTGLGLYICKRIVHDASGQIGYENHAERRGATFWFTLPAQNSKLKTPNSENV